MGTLPIIESDEWLRSAEGEIYNRFHLYQDRLKLIEQSSGSLSDYANAHLYFGVHRDNSKKGWWVRDYLPAAREVFVFGDWNNWNRKQFPLTKDKWGTWSCFISDQTVSYRLGHGSLIKLSIHGADDSWADRIPTYIRRVIQDEDTKDYIGQIWSPSQQFDWQDDEFDISSIGNPIIYEAHVGMSSEEEKISSYSDFTANILPRIKGLGYNTVQLMAVAEHPYYGSFGYHVSNIFAPSSRFGTPDELKELIRTAHSMGMGVIMDLVHSHYVKNYNEGFNHIDGSDTYSPSGEEGNHVQWDSKLYDYGRDCVLHLLLSNVKYWIDEFHFDGYRFDGVTSMLYKHHGYIDNLGSYDNYFGPSVNHDAIVYLTLANKLIRDVNPSAITIAEDVSGMPGIATPIEDGGIGFDYRLAMAIPDFWIRYLEDVTDENWSLGEMWYVMCDRLSNVKTITYCESHDQALVGDKTIAFRLMDKEMYSSMSKAMSNIVVDRGIALHKMIRLFTITLSGNGYLNFMGNEFGHPEWVDFPRKENGWSYKYARRQWSLAKADYLRYCDLELWDKDMISLVKNNHLLSSGYGYNILTDEDNKTIVYELGGLVFVFNWHPSRSIMDYEFPMPVAGKYKIVLNSDDPKYSGFGRVEDDTEFFTYERDGRHYLRVYNISRSVQVFKLQD